MFVIKSEVHLKIYQTTKIKGLIIKRNVKKKSHK